MRIDGPQITGSFNLNGDTVGDMDVFATTSSLNNLTASVATTGSNLFKGTQTISGSIIPAVDNTYDLGSDTHQFRDLYLSSASLYIDGTKVLSSTTQELQITTDAGQSFKILEAGSDTITLQSNDGNITLATSGGGDVILDPTTGIIALKGTTQVYAGNKVRSSDGNNIVFGDGLTVSGSVTVTGFIETQELRTTYISSSILYRSGSTKFGDDLGDTHSFTGSLSVSGSLIVPGSGLVSGSSQISYTGLSNVPSGLVSGSSQVSFTGTTGYSTYINQALLTTSNSTFNSVTAGDFRYSGTGYITYDVANSGTDSLVVRKYGTTVLTLNSSGYLGVNVDPSFYLDVQSNVANTFYTIAQFENRDYTSGTRSFIRVRNWLSAGGSYSSYFGQGQDGKTYIIANNSARGGDIVIDGGNGNVGVADSSPSQKLTVAGSIKINQDAALRAGSSDNWIIGQDSGTNLIHIGSTAVANDIRFDSSTASGNIIIKANGRLGVNTTDPAGPFDVNGYMGLRSNNYFYFGHTTSNIGGWTTRMYADGSTHKFNANGFVFNNEGYGSATWLSINSSGNATFSGTITANNNITTNATLFLTKNIVAGESTPLHFNYTTSDGVGPAIRMGTGTQGFWDVQPSSNNTRLSFEWSDTTNTLNLYSNGSVSVGSAIANVSNKLAVGGAVRANNSVYNWYQNGTNDWDGYQYLHLKTNLSSGASGNVDHTMSLFYGRLYSYSSAYIREGHYGFHNWSGALYNPVTTGNFWSGGYSSSDGFVVLVVALGGGTYFGINIDWHQSYPYGFRDRTVTAVSRSNSSSGVY